jgi:RimJ/RimL family protein N-acetyltransferase
MSGFSILTERLILGPLLLNDAPVLFSYRSDVSVCKYQSWKPKQLKEAVTFIKKYAINSEIEIGKWKQLAIRLKTNLDLIGDCGFLLYNKRKVEIGYTIAPGYQNRGFALEAVNGLLFYLFNDLKIRLVIAQTDPENNPSIALLKKIGFCEKAKLSGKTGKDDLYFELSKKEYKN